jgi:cyclopropane-fatty-acyl-phospholipid synthase
MKTALHMVDRGYVPIPVVRHGIRRLLRERLAEQRAIWQPDAARARDAWLALMRAGPIALVPDKANEQHYEVPPAFFELVLGPRLKYSSTYYPSADTTLAASEDAMLALTAERAELRDGQDVLELGCGWGSLTLWMAERYPRSRIRAVSNSAPQRAFILARARERGLDNVQVDTCDMNGFDPGARFDRVVSVEMFEHMRDWETLLARIARWLRPDGRLFLHYFAHARWAWAFDVKDETDWMSRHFFSGGMMPSRDLALDVASPLVADASWTVPGTHYTRSSEDWIANMRRRRPEILAVFSACYGPGEAERWFQRWRVFFLSCAELFGWDEGREWVVAHHRLRLAEGGAS